MAALALFDGERRRIIQRRERIFRPRDGILFGIGDADVISRYRFSREGIRSIITLVERDLLLPTKRSQAIQPVVQVLVSLRYLGKGDFFSEVADLHGISKASMSRILTRFVDAVNNRLDNICFPSTRQELEDTRVGFLAKAGISGVVGAIDGTLIPILAPHENEDAYVCRKGYHALNIQAVADHELRFTNVVTKWPGSQHDAGIFDDSRLKDYLQEKKVGHLLGDSGYPLRDYLLTPVMRPSNQAEAAYNLAHSRTRMVVERAFGVLKCRFRCLHKTAGCLPFKPPKCGHVIQACMRLHNKCIDDKVVLPNNADDINDVCRQDEAVGEPLQSAVDKRNAIIRQFRR